MIRLMRAIEALLKRFEHHDLSEPTASIMGHLPVPELIELRAAHAEATAEPPAETPAESATEMAAEPPAEPVA